MVSRTGAQLRWILVILLGICKLPRGVGNEEDLGDCPALQCCEDECCGPGTSWDIDIEYCTPDPGSIGFLEIFNSDIVPVCEVKICCEDSCYFDGTYYDPSMACCLPLTMPTEYPVAPTSSPISSPTPTASPTIVLFLQLPAPAFRPNISGFTFEDAVALCRNTLVTKQKVARIVMNLAIFLTHSPAPGNISAFPSFRVARTLLLHFQIFPLIHLYFHRGVIAWAGLHIGGKGHFHQAFCCRVIEFTVS